LRGGAYTLVLLISLRRRRVFRDDDCDDDRTLYRDDD